jgi:hypothetical protein
MDLGQQTSDPVRHLVDLHGEILIEGQQGELGGHCLDQGSDT